MSDTPVVVSVDPGSSWMKMLLGDGRRAYFEAAVRPVPAGADYGPDTITVDGTRYVVGEAAIGVQTNPDNAPSGERDYHGGVEQHVQLCYGLARLGVTRCDVMAISLPYARSRDPELGAKLAAQTVFRWQQPGPGGELAERVVHVADGIRITAQGTGALWQYEAEGRADKLYSVCCVDIGSQTTDVVVVERRSDGDFHMSYETCASLQTINTQAFYHQWADKVRGLTGLQGRKFNYYRLMGLAMHNTLEVRHMGQRVSVAAEFQQVQRDFTLALRQAVAAATGERWFDFDRVLLAGGGAKLVDLKTWGDGRTETLDVWANAEGQMLELEREDETTTERKEVA